MLAVIIAAGGEYEIIDSIMSGSQAGTLFLHTVLIAPPPPPPLPLLSTGTSTPLRVSDSSTQLNALALPASSPASSLAGVSVSAKAGGIDISPPAAVTEVALSGKPVVYYRDYFHVSLYFIDMRTI